MNLDKWAYATAAFALSTALVTGYSMYQSVMNKAVVAKLEATVAKRDKSISELKDNLTIVVEANGNLETALQNQSKAMEQWLKDSEAKQKQSADKLASVELELRRLKKKYADILSAPPIIPTDECRSLDIRMREYLRARGES